MYRHGVGASERIRMEIRRAWQFRFNWWFKSRSTPDIQKRCEFLVRAIEKEIEDRHKLEDDERKPTSPERDEDKTS
jgi:SWI/SNF-related matrix-associated actin-dependent regulator of chromatin subfamily A member 5